MVEWREHRSRVLAQARRIVVKVGSAVLTSPLGLDARVIGRLVDQVAGLHDRGLDVILVSSGAVAAGRGAIRDARPDLAGLPAKQAASAVGQSRLMHAYDEAFGRFGKISAQILLTREDLRSRSRFLNARNTFQTLFAWRVIPIVNENDTVSTKELAFGDNDALASLILNLAQADLFVNLTSAPGVFDKNPETNLDARRIECIEHIGSLDLEEVCEGKTTVGTGGMYSKLLAARRAAQIGVSTLILPGREPFVLERAFEGEEVGTWIMPEAKAISRRKFWLAYNAEPSGEIVVDEGAARALREQDKSLLPVGVTRVEGSFGAGALVRITDLQGRPIGLGLSNYRSADLKKVMGRKSAEVISLLGNGSFQEAVHRDNMVVDPAI